MPPETSNPKEAETKVIPKLSDDQQRWLNGFRADLKYFSAGKDPSFKLVQERFTVLETNAEEINRLPGDQRDARMKECNIILSAAWAADNSKLFLQSIDDVFILDSQKEGKSQDDFQRELAELGVQGEDELTKLRELQETVKSLLDRFDVATIKELQDLKSTLESPMVKQLIDNIYRRRYPVVSQEARKEIEGILNQIKEINSTLPAEQLAQDSGFSNSEGLAKFIKENLDFVNQQTSRATPESLARRIQDLKDVLQRAMEARASHAASSPTATGGDTGAPDADPDTKSADPDLTPVVADATAASQEAKEKIADVLSQFEEGMKESGQLKEFFDQLTFDSLADLAPLKTKFADIFSSELLATLGVEESAKASVKDAVVARYWNVFLESVTDCLRLEVAKMEQKGRVRKEAEYAAKTLATSAVFATVSLGIRSLLTPLALPAVAIGAGVGAITAGFAHIVGSPRKQEKELAELLEKIEGAEDKAKKGIINSLQEGLSTILEGDQNRSEKLAEMERFLMDCKGAKEFSRSNGLTEKDLNDLQNLIALTREVQQNPKDSDRQQKRHDLMKDLSDRSVLQKWGDVYTGGVVFWKARDAFEANNNRQPNESEINLLKQQVFLAAERDMNALLGDVVAQEQIDMMQGSEHYLETYKNKLFGREHPETVWQAMMKGAAAGAVSAAVATTPIAGAVYMGLRRGESALRSEILKSTHEVKTAREVVDYLETLVMAVEDLKEPKDTAEFKAYIFPAIQDARTRVKLPDMKEADRARIEKRIVSLQNAWIKKSVLFEVENSGPQNFGEFMYSFEDAQKKAKDEKASKQWLSGGLGRRFMGLSGKERLKVLGIATGRAAEGAFFGAIAGKVVGSAKVDYNDPNSFTHSLVHHPQAAFHTLVSKMDNVVNGEPGGASSAGNVDAAIDSTQSGASHGAHSSESSSPDSAENNLASAHPDSGAAGGEAAPADPALAAAQLEFQNFELSHGLSQAEMQNFAPHEQTPEAFAPIENAIQAYHDAFNKCGFTDATRQEFVNHNPNVAVDIAHNPHLLEEAHTSLTDAHFPEDQIDDLLIAHAEVVAHTDSIGEIMAKLETAGVPSEVAAKMFTETQGNFAELTTEGQRDFITMAVTNTHPGLEQAGYKVNVDEAGKVSVTLELGKGEALGKLEQTFAQLTAERMDAGKMFDGHHALTEMAAAKLVNVANNLTELTEGRGMASYQEQFGHAGVTFDHGTLTIHDLAAFEATVGGLLEHADTIEDTLTHGAIASIDNYSSQTWNEILALKAAADEQAIAVPDFSKSATVTRAEQEIGTANAHHAFGDAAENIHVIDENTSTFTHHGAMVEIHGGHITSYDSVPVDVDVSGGAEAIGSAIFDAQVAHEVSGLEADAASMQDIAQELHGGREPLTADERAMVHTVAENHIAADDVREGGHISRPLVELIAREHLSGDQAHNLHVTHELVGEHLKNDIPYSNLKEIIVDKGWSVEHPDGVEGVLVVDSNAHTAVHLTPQPASDTLRATLLPEYASGATYDETAEVQSPLTHEAVGRDLKISGVQASALIGVTREIPAQAQEEAGVVHDLLGAARDKFIFDKLARDLKPEQVDKLLGLPVSALDLHNAGASHDEVEGVARAVGTNQTDDVREVVEVIKHQLGPIDWHRGEDSIRDVLQFKIQQDVHAPVETAAASSSEAAAHDDHHGHANAEAAHGPAAERAEAAPSAPETPAHETDTLASGPESGSAADVDHAYTVLASSLQDEKGNILNQDEINTIIHSDDSDARAALAGHIESMSKLTHEDPQYSQSEELHSVARGLDQILHDIQGPHESIAATPEQTVAIPGGDVQFLHDANGRVSGVRVDAKASGPIESLNDNYRATALEHAAAANKGGYRNVDIQITKLEEDAREIDIYRHALSELEKDGKGNSPEAAFLHRNIDGKILRLEQKYGDVFRN